MTNQPWFPTDYGDPIPGIHGLVAAGTGQADATLVPKKINVFVTVPAGAGAVLPTSFQPGAHITILNRSANDLLVYPSFGDQIESYRINTPVTVVAGGQGTFWTGAQPLDAKPRTWWTTT